MSSIIQHKTLSGLASHLIKDGLLDVEFAVQSQKNASDAGISLVTYLVKNNFLNSEIIAQSCAKTFGLPIYDLKNITFNSINKLQVSPDIIRQYRVIPLRKENNILFIGMSDPTDRQALDTVTFHSGLNTQPVIVAEDQLEEFLKKNFNDNFKNKTLVFPKEFISDENASHIQENSVNYDEPLIRFVDNLIQHAIQQSASDIHIEPYKTKSRIRYRQDGIMHDVTDLPIQLTTRLITRLKVMSELDIAERRLPQDGRLQRYGIDIRINTCPTIFGEKIVLRLLNSSSISLNFSDLGFTETQQHIFLNKISQPQGLILVTGPTGSGKTVTLYSALHFLNTSEKNIISIEDPVEIQLPGINQVNVNPKIGLDFSNTLRTFLRQDPDILMVGEIRDLETANIAIQAAQTGHLVLSTLHTNNAIDTIVRLQSMGIASYNLINSISLIIAQRLVRKLCSYCKSLDTRYSHFKFEIYKANQCENCVNGYTGRTGIYEFLPITEKLTDLILSGASKPHLTNQIEKESFFSLREAGLEKMRLGITSLSEINRVSQI